MVLGDQCEGASSPNERETLRDPTIISPRDDHLRAKHSRAEARRGAT